MFSFSDEWILMFSTLLVASTFSTYMWIIVYTFIPIISDNLQDWQASIALALVNLCEAENSTFILYDQSKNSCNRYHPPSSPCLEQAQLRPFHNWNGMKIIFQLANRIYNLSVWLQCWDKRRTMELAAFLLFAIAHVWW